ncbi:MAG TPA: NAD-dependent epimerase/dehydratase family protein [Bryobacteraceae bacterium]|nr:NAD-dependent epimerase/dehydratase family protein [Bryobacteraceae bacterium]
MRVLVIGGTLFIGRVLVHELTRAGHEVTILHRRPGHDLGKRVHEIIGDRNEPESLRAALADREFEVVFDNVYDWQRGTTAAQVEATATLCAERNKLHRYLYMSSVAAYGDGLNHHEGDALAPDNHPDAYVRNKAMSERALFRLHHRHQLPVVTLRPPFVYGPGNPYYREAFFWDRIRDNRPVILPGDGRRLMQFAYVKDLVHACLQAMQEHGAVGHAFNIGNPRPVSQAELVELLGDVAGRRAMAVRIPRERILRAGGHPMGPKLYFGFYFDLPAITMMVTRAQRVLHFQPTDFAEGLRESYRWYLRHHEKDSSNYLFEDSLLALAASGAPPSAF